MRIATSCTLLLSLLAAACSSSSSGSAPPPCNQNPWECSSAQTCWPQSQTAFECMNAGPGTEGSTCQDTVGSPTCGPGLFCLQGLSSATGTCLAYCSTTDSKHACTGDAVCATGALGGAGGPEFSLCVPMPSANGDGGISDGGTGADGNGTADGGTDASAGG